MADNNYNVAKERETPKRGVMELNSLDAMLAQQKILTQRINSLHAKFEGMQKEISKQVQLVCDFCQDIGTTTYFHTRGSVEDPEGVEVEMPEDAVELEQPKLDSFSA
ncbi:hypothetical protein SESBI_33267 [Sesbania bispinosa]|nr:hypothetical protein SESBI_33267 [Sesbania bispinosa]